MLQVDKNAEGFLLDLNTWNLEIAQHLAREENIELSTEHLAIINIIREFYQEYNLHPGMRVLIKVLQQKIASEDHKIDSIYIHMKFPHGIKQLSKIAGLPKPINCI